MSGSGNNYQYFNLTIFKIIITVKKYCRKIEKSQHLRYIIRKSTRRNDNQSINGTCFSLHQVKGLVQSGANDF